MGTPKPCSQVLGSPLSLGGKRFQFKGIGFSSNLSHPESAPWQQLVPEHLSEPSWCRSRDAAPQPAAPRQQPCLCSQSLWAQLGFGRRLWRPGQEARRQKSKVPHCLHTAAATDDPNKAAGACSALVLPGLPLAGGHWFFSLSHQNQQQSSPPERGDPGVPLLLDRATGNLTEKPRPSSSSSQTAPCHHIWQQHRSSGCPLCQGVTPFGLGHLNATYVGSGCHRSGSLAKYLV